MGQEGCSHYANGEYRFLEGPLLAKSAVSLGRLARAIIIAAIMNAGEYLYL